MTLCRGIACLWYLLRLTRHRRRDTAIMAGINRLGKGPAKPGTMRPADPNKYKTTDIFSEGTEGDKDFQRMVQDIEDTQQNHSGWLFGRGAFDKGDLLYLRDEEEKKRYAEQELREAETRAFNLHRQRVMALNDESLPASNPAHLSKLAEKLKHADSLKSRIKVKPPARVKLKHEPEVLVKNEGPSEKRLKTEDAIKVKKEEDDSIEALRSQVKQEHPSAASHNLSERQTHDPSASEQEDAGLGGLLGDYGSESDGEDTGQKSVGGDKLPLPDFLQVPAKPA